jgi:hypothetical protein
MLERRELHNSRANGADIVNPSLTPAASLRALVEFTRYHAANTPAGRQAKRPMVGANSVRPGTGRTSSALPLALTLADHILDPLVAVPNGFGNPIELRVWIFNARGQFAPARRRYLVSPR